MHDVFEGVAVVDPKCMLVVFIQEQKIFNLSTLNSRIKSFPFGFPDAKSDHQLMCLTLITMHMKLD